MSTRLRLKRALVPVAALAALSLAACSGGSGSSGTSGGADQPAGDPVAGGEVTSLLDAAFAGSYPAGLDPATNVTGGGNLSLNQAVFGGLFLIKADDDGSNAEVQPYLAESGQLSDDAKTLTIKLREGLKYSDGTPLDAESLKWNFERNLNAECTCAPRWELVESNPITVKDPLTVEVKFAQANAAILASLPVTNVNWPVSKPALDKAGEDAFKTKPVGAGPFTVTNMQLSSVTELAKNPNFFDEGKPYLDKLTFRTVGGDQPAYQTLQSGQAQAYEGMNNVQLIDQAEQSGRFQVTIQPATSPYVVQLNTKVAPFNDKKAREAIYYATDFDAIAKGVFKDKYKVSQTFTGEGGRFHKETIDGYRTHDLNKAKQLVQELGGLEVRLGTISAPTAVTIMTALQTQWQEAGIKVTTNNHQLSGVIQEFTSGKWQAMLQTAGAWDPAAGVGVGFRFNTGVPYSGVADPKLDDLLAKAIATTDEAERQKSYDEAGKLISDQAYAPFGLAFAPTNVASKDVHGPGLTTKVPGLAVNVGVNWSEVWRAKG